MKFSIIEDIFFGRCGQIESLKLNERRRELNDKCIELYNSLQKTLNDGQAENLENLLNAEAKDEDERAFTCFKEGLKFGVLLLFECFNDCH